MNKRPRLAGIKSGDDQFERKMMRDAGRGDRALQKPPEGRSSNDWADIDRHPIDQESRNDGMSGSRSYAAGGQVQPITFRGGRSFRAPQFNSPTDGPAAPSDGGGAGSGAVTTGTLLDQKSNPYFDVDGRGSGEMQGRGNDLSGLPVDNSMRGLATAALNVGKFAMSPAGFFVDVLLDAAMGNNNPRPAGRINAMRSIADRLTNPSAQGAKDETPAPRDLTPGGPTPLGPSSAPPGTAPGTGAPGQNYDPVTDFSTPGRGGGETAPAPTGAPGPAPSPTGGFTDTVSDLDASARSGEAAQSAADSGAAASAQADAIGSGLYRDGGPIPGEEGQPVPITAHAKEYVLPVEFMEMLGEYLTGSPDADAAAAVMDDIVSRITGRPTNSGPNGMGLEEGEGDEGGEEMESEEENDDGMSPSYGQSPQRLPAPPAAPSGPPTGAPGRLASMRAAPGQFPGR